jgi:hypothetical protein
MVDVFYDAVDPRDEEEEDVPVTISASAESDSIIVDSPQDPEYEDGRPVVLEEGEEEV